MSAALYYWRATRWRSRRSVLVVALICGLLGMVALGALAGARRTDTAYGRYLHAINSSDVFVNVPGPVLPVIRQVERLPGVASAAATVGLNANPVVNGGVNDGWLTNGLTGSLDGDGFRQDRLTVLAGRLPRPGATGEIALTAGQARFFHTGVGGHVTYAFYRQNLKTNVQVPARRSTFLVTAIVVIPRRLGTSSTTSTAPYCPRRPPPGTSTASSRSGGSGCGSQRAAPASRRSSGTWPRSRARWTGCSTCHRARFT